MAYAEIEVHTEEFEEGFRLAMDGYREFGDQFVEFTADKVVEIARELAPKRTERLAESIHRDPLVREGEASSSVEVVAGGAGIRETVFMEYGSAHARAQPFMRPAMAMAAGALRGIGIGARLRFDRQAALFRRRAIARAKVAQAQRRGQLSLSPAEARAVGRFISQRFRYRRDRRAGRA